MKPDARPVATRPMPALYGGFINVPAYVMAEPRKRGPISKWLAERRAEAQERAIIAGGRNGR